MRRCCCTTLLAYLLLLPLLCADGSEVRVQNGGALGLTCAECTAGETTTTSLDLDSSIYTLLHKDQNSIQIPRSELEEFDRMWRSSRNALTLSSNPASSESPRIQISASDSATDLVENPESQFDSNSLARLLVVVLIIGVPLTVLLRLGDNKNRRHRYIRRVYLANEETSIPGNRDTNCDGVHQGTDSID